MLCENCNENEATIHYTEVINGVKNEHHLCSECASKLDLAYYGNMFGTELPFAKLLTGLFAAGKAAAGTEENPMAHIICPQCGMNFEEFTRVGKFGCAECYNVFGPLIDDNIRKIQGSSEHMGKKYANAKKEEVDLPDVMQKEKFSDKHEEIALLQAKLKEAVELENYEDAASLRDRIRSLKAKKE
ncbi:MAG: UvrB/UvrC motif-containing protein [Clostridia bacterium]|nr:UvrB/UvrC motif-containing protein [Clostridia bacterium]